MSSFQKILPNVESFCFTILHSSVSGRIREIRYAFVWWQYFMGYLPIGCITIAMLITANVDLRSGNFQILKTLSSLNMYRFMKSVQITLWLHLLGCSAQAVIPLHSSSSFAKIINKLHLPGKSRLIFSYNAKEI